MTCTCWQGLREVICLKVNYEGCALCDATWGSYYRTLEGSKLFFCCSICADAFENMIRRVREEKAWNRVDAVEISGNYSIGRTCSATSGSDEVRYFFKHENGTITEFKIL